MDAETREALRIVGNALENAPSRPRSQGKQALSRIEQTLRDLSERLYVAEKRGDELARLLNAAREAEPALIRVLRSSAEATEQRERALREALEYVLDALDIEHVDDAHLSNAVDKAHALLSAQATQEVR